MNGQKKRRRWTIAIAILAIATQLYVLSYAPAVRYFIPAPTGGFERPPVITVPLYRPVEYLIDYTPAKRPLLWWADVWGVWLPTYVFSKCRESEREYSK